jgi:hypothetical protein
MAKLRNLDKIHALAPGERVTVGNNRTVERTERGYTCCLHGHPIALVALGSNGEAFLTLDECGYLTHTTAEAMQDFAKAFGARLGVSIALRLLSVRWVYEGAWHEKIIRPGHISIVADRFPA